MPEGEVVRSRRHAPNLVCVLALVLALWGCGSGGGGDGPAPVSPPPQPTGLTAEAGDGEIHLSWTANAAATRWDYRQRSGDGAWGAWTTVPGSSSGTTGHTVADLENGTKYGFQVRAVNAGGAGPASAETTATPVPPVPPQPADLTAMAGDGLVELSWTPLDTALGWEYRLRKGDGEWGPWTTVPDSSPETAGHTVADLENGITYGFQIRAVNAGGAGPASAEATATPVVPAVPIEIPDAKLRRGLEGVLGKAAGEPITDVELGGLRSLSAAWWGIVDLTGLEHATGLRFLDLDNNQIHDVAPLASLALVTSLELNGNDVSDLTPLASMISLTRLEIYGNGVSELAPLSALVSLEDLRMGYNDVVDLSPLSGLTSLTRLEVYDNRVSDLTPLAALTSLEHLDLIRNRVADISPLAGLQDLVVLRFYGNKAADLSPVAGLTSLEHLHAGYNGVVDLQPLVDLTSLTHLFLHANRIEDISALAGLSSLVELSLGWGNPVSDMGPLSGLTALRRLDLIHMPTVEDLSFVSGMEDLEDLNLHGTSVNDLGALSALRKLETLDIGETEVEDISPLADLGSLRTLFIHSLAVDLEPLADLVLLDRVWQTNWTTEGERPKVDIAPLAGLPNLRVLAASPAQGDLSPLADLTSLVWLHLREPGTPFDNLEALEGLSNLSELTMDHGELEGISSLATLVLLRELNLENNRIEDLAPLAGLASLHVLDLDHNQVHDVAALVENPGLGTGDTVSLAGDPLGADALTTHIPELEARGVSVAYDRDDFPDSPLRVLRDQAVSMEVEADLHTAGWDLDLTGYAQEFISHFGDEFDVLLFMSALDSTSHHADLPYYGVYYHVSNDVRGIGLDELRRPPDNASRLKGLIHFPWLGALSHGPSLHELMHAWANYGVETAYRSHWGFSSAAGQLGGFRLDDLVDLGGGRWSAGSFGTIANGGNEVPYSPWELYLGGFVGPDEVPDLWVAAEGRWTDERTDAGRAIFEAAEHSTLTVEGFVETHGAREPDHVSAPKELRGAVIVLEDDDHQLHHWHDLLEQVRWLSHPGPDAANRRLYNYHEATGGRGRLVLDGLRELRRETPLSAISTLRLIQVCPAPGAGVATDGAPTVPATELILPPADFGEGRDLRPGGRTEDRR